MKEKRYTAGELAAFAGITVRTVRFYDIKGLLKPVGYSESGYRYYDEKSLEILQKILMLKFLGFSLEQIADMVSNDGMQEGTQALRSSLAMQKNLLVERRRHIDRLLAAVDAAKEADENKIWERLSHIMQITSYKEVIEKQYADDSNLQKRIDIHAYSTAEQGWMEWMYERLPIKSGMKILEIGCGNGLLWKTILHELPENLDIYLTDYSEGMLESARHIVKENEAYLKQKRICFRFARKDAENLIIEEEGYDLILANHMLYHVVEHRQELLCRIKGLLKEDGAFCCSTVGETHLQELDELLYQFDKNIDKMNTVDFTLENGKSQLEKVFSEISLEEQENDLLVDDAEVIYNYVSSYPGNAASILAVKGDKLRSLLEARIEKEGAIFIHKSVGLFTCRAGLPE